MRWDIPSAQMAEEEHTTSHFATHLLYFVTVTATPVWDAKPSMIPKMCSKIQRKNMAGWWFQTWIWNFPFHIIGDVILPIDFHSIIFQRGRAQPPTRWYCWWSLGALVCFYRSARKSPQPVQHGKILVGITPNLGGFLRPWGMPPVSWQLWCWPVDFGHGVFSHRAHISPIIWAWSLCDFLIGFSRLGSGDERNCRIMSAQSLDHPYVYIYIDTCWYCRYMDNRRYIRYTLII